MKEIFDYILSLFKSRIFPLIMVFIVLIGVLVNRLFSLQIINGESYVKDLSSSIQKDMQQQEEEYLIRMAYCLLIMTLHMQSE